MRKLHESFLNGTNNNQLRIELTANAIEADVLRSIILTKSNSSNDRSWEDKTHALQLTRLKLEQRLKQAERRA